MKKIISKLTKSKEQPATRITNETVAEHRERILAGGRKFKYPVQYAKHRLVINTIVISVGSLLIIILLCWWQLYSLQNTSSFFYRLTQIIPLPVATISGEQVRYSDYLMRFRSSLHFLQQQNMINLNSDDGKRQVDHLKRQSLDQAVESAYVNKLARDKNIIVKDEEIDMFITRERESQQSPLSEEAYKTVVLRGFYDWSLDEYKSVVKSTLLKRKISFAVDPKAKEKIEAIEMRLKTGEDFASVAKEVSDDSTKANGGDVGLVSRASQDQDGLLKTAASLQPNAISGIIQGTDGYYIVKLLQIDSNQLRYARIKVTPTQFANELKQQKDKNLQTLITIGDVS